MQLEARANLMGGRTQPQDTQPKYYECWLIPNGSCVLLPDLQVNLERTFNLTAFYGDIIWA